ncbi:MAG: type II toxin-antitoxin system RelB/DinJ family antitoxin [Bifidobacteriaceae bacterium]|jgi:DNA-damage-inducible protein J|nr:type II toxin-antitoxin system RelB/DinJ family antitoxin [Bifidobacteriaceae bacterium]
MSSVNINIRTDAQTKTQAQRVFASLGLDMTTAINLFLRQTVRDNDLPFAPSTRSSSVRSFEGRLPYGFGSLRDKIWMADDFDEPLADFSEYTQ